MGGKGRDRPGAKKVSDPGSELLRHLRLAYEEWQAAQRLFAEVTEPDLVEWAALHLKACEERYRYLWRQARRAGVHGCVGLRGGWA